MWFSASRWLDSLYSFRPVNRSSQRPLASPLPVRSGERYEGLVWNEAPPPLWPAETLPEQPSFDRRNGEHRTSEPSGSFAASSNVVKLLSCEVRRDRLEARRLDPIDRRPTAAWRREHRGDD